MPSFAEMPGVVRDLMLLRRGPQDLPHSEVLLLVLALTAVVGESLLATRMLGAEDFAGAAVRVAASVGIVLAVTFALLRAHQRQARFVQTGCALIAVALLFALATAVVLSMALPLPKDRATMTGAQMLAGALSLVIVAWQLLVRGNIFRHALEVPLARGVTLALSLTLAELLLAIGLAQFAPALPTP